MKTMSSMASCPVAVFSLLSNAAEGPPAPATSATPSLGRLPVAHSETREVTSIETNDLVEPAPIRTDPSTWPRSGEVSNVTVLSSHAPLTRCRSSVPGVVTLLTQSFSVAFATPPPRTAGGSTERSNFRNAVELGA
jgi:hypothetical protein